MQNRNPFINQQTQKWMRNSCQLEKRSDGLVKEDLQTLCVLFNKVSNNISIRQLAYHIRQHFMTENYVNSQPQNTNMNTLGSNYTISEVNGSSKISLMDAIQYSQSQTINLEGSREKTQNLHRPLSQSNAACDMKSKYLEFFLRCEAKLFDKNSDQQWKDVFKRQILKYEKLLQISTSLISKIKFRLSWVKFTNLVRPKIKISSIFQQRYNKKQNKIQKIETSISQIADIQIQVEQDIKVKTKYFFKWCKFLRQAQQAKAIRLKELQNLQKSISFHGYTMKQNIFNHWKDIVSKKRQERALIAMIQNKRIFNMAQNFVSTLKSTKELRKIQEGMESVVQSKIMNMRTCFVFKLLNVNRQRNRKIVSNVKHVISIWQCRALSFLSESLIPNEAKSYKEMQQNFNKNYSSKCLQICLIVLKNNLQNTKIKIKQVHRILQRNCLVKALKRVKKINSEQKYCEQLGGLLTQKKRARLIFLLSLNRINSGVKMQKLQVLQKSLKHSKINRLLNLKEQNRTVMESFIDSQKKLENRLKDFQKARTIKALTSYYKMAVYEKKKVWQVSKFIMIAALSHVKVCFDYKKQVRARQMTLKQKIQSRLKGLVFESLRESRQLRKLQKRVLNKISGGYLKQWSIIILKTMKQVKTLRSNMKRLITALDKQIVKKCFSKIFKPSLKIISFIKMKEQQRERCIKRDLFEMIRAISILHNERILEIRSFIEENAKSKIYQRLIAKKEIEKKSLSLTGYIKNQNQRIVFLKLRQKREVSKVKLCNKIKVFGSIFLNKFVSIVRRKASLKNKIKQTRQKIGESRKQNSFNLLLEKIPEIKEVQLVQCQKYKALTKLRIKRSFERVKKNVNLLKEHSSKTLSKKIKQTQQIIKKHTFRYLAFPQKIEQVKRLINRNYVNLFFKYMQESHSISKKVERLYYRKSGILIRSALIWHHQKENIRNEENCKLEQLKRIVKNKQFEESKQFIQLAMANKDLSKKIKMIAKRGVKQHFGSLIRNILIERSETIKDKVAIIHYAKNIKKKVINSFLINSLRIKHKQNNVHASKQSKITIIQPNQNTNAAKVQKILAQSRRSDKISDKISRFNMTKSRQVKMI